MIKIYKSTDRETFSKNFCSKEFYCKCGRNHDNLISTELIEKLQALVDVLGADKAIITSGYRCPAHDKAVKGTGYGMHTKGLAADVVFYKGNTPICTKWVACKAQDLGFNGIGNIDSSYTAIHLDVRTGSKWYGDEAVKGGTSSTITNDYYKYYGFTNQNNNHIKELQQILNSKGGKLAVDGIAGAETLREVKKYTIEKGDKGELVKWVQNRLIALGHVVGSADGIAGDKTMAAIAEWQKIHGLGVGYLGGSDWTILLNGK